MTSHVGTEMVKLSTEGKEMVLVSLQILQCWCILSTRGHFLNLFFFTSSE